MKLTPGQEKAYDSLGAWMKSDDPIFVLAGYAGTGKTTLINRVTESLNKRAYHCAFTGKAALAMREKGISGATTIHSMIYKYLRAEQKITMLRELRVKLTDAPTSEHPSIQAAIEALNADLSKPTFMLNYESEAYNAPLIIVDEYSMLNEQLVTDLCKFGKKVLFVGDPGQLDPVDEKDPKAKSPLKPNEFLTDVVRQALDSPIIRAATSVREKGTIVGIDNCAEFAVAHKFPGVEIMETADQVICGLNKTRQHINKLFESEVNQGAKVVCLQNNHAKGLFNGMVGYIKAVSPGDEGDTHTLDITSGGNDYEELPVWKGCFEGRKIDFEVRERGLEFFDYGYAITCHKAQGSEWDRVLVVADWPAAGPKWLYTAITRARKQCRVYFTR